MNEDFDPRGCRVMLAIIVCSWIAIAAALWEYAR